MRVVAHRSGGTRPIAADHELCVQTAGEEQHGRGPHRIIVSLWRGVRHHFTTSELRTRVLRQSCSSRALSVTVARTPPEGTCEPSLHFEPTDNRARRIVRTLAVRPVELRATSHPIRPSCQSTAVKDSWLGSVGFFIASSLVCGCVASADDSNPVFPHGRDDVKDTPRPAKQPTLRAGLGGKQSGGRVVRCESDDSVAREASTQQCVSRVRFCYRRVTVGSGS